MSRGRCFTSSAAGLALLLLLVGCGPPPRPADPPLPGIPSPVPATHLAQVLAPLIDAHPGHSGVLPLYGGREAFAARIALARVAEKTLDVQYYIWRPDLTGILMFEALLEAADRGVQVRLLLDDNNWRDIDPYLMELDAHPNIQVRLFNPFVLRGARVINFLTDFDRLNRRMHNKSFTVDGMATIVGGRNIADAYFDATEEILFADLDVLAVGPVVADVADDFQAYWRSESSYPASVVLADNFASRGNISLRERIAQVRADEAAREYVDAVQQTKAELDLPSIAPLLDWSEVVMVSDDPAKGLDQAERGDMLPQQLFDVLGKPQQVVDLVSPYFVPTAAGLAAFESMVRNGVRIRVLTNALEATDITAVHAGYSRYRKPLLEAGVELYETRLQASPPGGGSAMFGLSGSSNSTSLHAKTFAVDGERVFIGSFNFDPRSANYNTEMGFVISSPALARQIDQTFDEEVPELAYRLGLNEAGEVIWEKRENGEVKRYTTEPGTSSWRRGWVKFLSWLPIEGLL